MFRNMKLSSKLTLGFGIVLVISAAVILVGTTYMNQIAAATKGMFDHPYTVHTEILRVQRNIIDMDRELGYILMETDAVMNPSALLAHAEEIDRLEAEAFEAFEPLYDRFLGDRALLDAALAAIEDWKPIRDEIIRLQRSGLTIQAANMDEEVNGPHMELIEEHIQEVVDFARNSASNFNEEAQRDAGFARSLILALFAVMAAVGILVAVVITRGITGPVSRLLSFTQEIAGGNLAVAAVDYQSR
ncbi:MAG: hypothetical protein GX335_02210, partial [Firmicutes bacterium]|nr:hypothetical protein [Bacillota bacterium]